MGFAIEERLEKMLTNPPRKLSRSVVLALRKNYGNRKSRKPWPQTETEETENLDAACDPVPHPDFENNHL